MGVEVRYPAEIQQYRVIVGRTRAQILLEGIEVPLGASAHRRIVGRIDFLDKTSDQEDFINRGGFLQMDRPLILLSGILDLLRHTKPLFLRAEGTLSTSSEFVGDEDGS